MTDKKLTVGEVLTNCFCKQCGCEASSNGYCKGKCAAMDIALTALTEIYGKEIDKLEEKVTGLSEIYTNGDLHILIMEMFDEVRKELGSPLNNKGGE